jgi:hypothetical protein
MTILQHQDQIDKKHGKFKKELPDRIYFKSNTFVRYSLVMFTPPLIIKISYFGVVELLPISFYKNISVILYSDYAFFC